MVDIQEVPNDTPSFEYSADRLKAFVKLPPGFSLDVTTTDGCVLTLTPMVPPGARRGARATIASVPPETPIGSYEATLGLTRDRAKLESYAAGRPPGFGGVVGSPDPTAARINDELRRGGPALGVLGVPGEPPALPHDFGKVLPFVKRDANGDLDLPALVQQGLSVIRQQTEAVSRASEARERRADRIAMLKELDTLLSLRAHNVLPEKLNARVERLTEALATEPS